MTAQQGTIPSLPSTPSSQVILSSASIPAQVTQLFRTKRVSEIRQFEARIRDEADEKSDALRQLLGSRYRDLLFAADRITQIREASAVHIRDALRSISSTATSLCEELDARSWIQPASPSEPTSPTVTDANIVRRRAIHVLSSRLKQIVDSPEVLYAFLEAGELYDAASRFVSAERNFRAVLETPSEEQRVAHNFLQSRWSLVTAFRSQILSAAERRLITPELQTSEYARVLATIVILTNDCDVASVVKGMLVAQTERLYEYSTKDFSIAAESMHAVATLIRKTLSCMACLFFHGNGSVEKLVHDVDPSLAQSVCSARGDGSLKKIIVDWTCDVRQWMEDRGAALLDVAKNSRQVVDALRAVDDVLSSNGWSDDCQVTLQEPPDFIFDIFRPVICSRAADVVRESIESAIRKTLVDVDRTWTDIDSSVNVSTVLWCSTASYAIGYERKGRADRTPHGKSRIVDEDKVIADMVACTGAVGGIIKSFDNMLSEALLDLSDLIQHVPTVSTAFEEAIRAGLPSIFENLKELVSTISGQQSDDEKERTYDNVEIVMQRLLFIARVSTAFSSTDSIGRAYSVGQMTGENHLKQSTALAELCRKASDVSSQAYQSWAKILCKTNESTLLKSLTDDKQLTVETGWTDNIIVNENGEIGNESSGDIGAVRVPTTASTGFVHFILNVCDAASKAGGFGLPQEAVESVRLAASETCISVYMSALKAYTGASDSETKQSSNVEAKHKDNISTVMMQLLFDVQYMRILLGDRSFGGSGRMEANRFSKLEGELRACIDPIDIASSQKAMRASVTAYSSRVSTLFGAIGNNDGIVKPSINRNSAISASANLVSLCKPVGRFTYLPAPMPSTYSSSNVGTAGLNAKAVVGALRNETGSVDDGLVRKRETFDASVAGYASKVSESVGRFGRGFFESLTRNVT